MIICGDGGLPSEGDLDGLRLIFDLDVGWRVSAGRPAVAPVTQDRVTLTWPTAGSDPDLTAAAARCG